MLGPRRSRAGDTVVVLYFYPGTEKWAGFVVGVLEKAYSGGGPGLVEVYLYPDSLYMEAFLGREASLLGATVAASYPVSHEAWSGVPRIHVATGELERLPSSIAEALLGHEALHSLLHGGLEYYLAEPGFGRLADYVASTSLKDLEVHLEMARRGFSKWLRAEKEYWLGILGSPWRPPESLEELSDTLRASTIWLAAGEKPPLSRKALEAIGEPLRMLARLAREYWLKKARPWRARREYTAIVENALERLGLHG